MLILRMMVLRQIFSFVFGLQFELQVIESRMQTMTWIVEADCIALICVSRDFLSLIHMLAEACITGLER